MEHTGGTVHTVLATCDFGLVHEADGFSIYECPMDGADSSWIVVRLDEPVTEDDLIAALEDAGVPRDAVIEALHQCGY